MRKTIKIDEDLCTGCSLCVSACKEGAIQLVDGKAKLVREDHCDGLGICLPVCPVNAISFEEAKPKMQDHTKNDPKAGEHDSLCSCPNAEPRELERTPPVLAQNPVSQAQYGAPCQTQLKQWPIQIKLVAPNARFFSGARLLIAADCAAFVYGNFHSDYMKNKITIIGCPKLDETDYADKLTTILRENDLKSVMVARIEVPCCAGLETATKTALQNCGKLIPWQVVTFSIDGKVLED